MDVNIELKRIDELNKTIKLSIEFTDLLKHSKEIDIVQTKLIESKMWLEQYKNSIINILNVK